MNWSLIILGLVAVSSVAIAENSYLVIVPKLLKVGHDNQFSIFIATASQPVEIKYQLTVGQKRVEGTTTCKAGETRNATMTLPMEFPVGAGELLIMGTGGVQFEEKRDVIVYDNRNVILVQTSASTYRPADTIEFRVIATNEELMPMENAQVLVEIYDATLKLVGRFPHIPVHSGMTETFKFPLDEHVNVGSWLVSATMGNTTSSVEILVARPITPSFDLKAIFQRFLLRSDKMLRGVIEIDSDKNEPIFGRAIIAVGQITEQDVQTMMKESPKQQQQQGNEEWRKWKSHQMDIAGRLEVNYDLMSMFNVDVSKALAVQVYIQVTGLTAGQERIIKHVIPIFTHDVIYDIRPLEFEAGIENEFEIIAKRPDGKPAKMEDMIVTVTMMMGNENGKVHEEKSVEIKEFYSRGRNDIGLFNMEIPEKCIGVLMTITPLDKDGKVRGYRTHAVPLRPTPRRAVSGAKLSIELLPTTNMPMNTESNTQVVSSQISTAGRTSNFYIQLVPSKPMEKFEPLPMSYVIMTNGRITLTGEFTMHPTKECKSKTERAMRPEGQAAPTCVFNATLPIQITRAMIPYSTMLVYTFQPTFGFNVAESYRFSVAGLFQGTFALNATVVPYSTISATAEDMDSAEMHDSSEEMDLKAVPISAKAQDKSRVELSFTGTPGATVGLNVVEYDGVMQGLSNEITKERVLQYLTTYEQVPIVGMPTMPEMNGDKRTPVARTSFIEDEKTTTAETTADKKRSDMKTDKEMPTEQMNNEMTENDEKSKERRSSKLMSKMSSPMAQENTMISQASMKINSRSVMSETDEQEHMMREHMGFKVRYPIEKMIFGMSSSRGLKPLEGDDVYTTSNMGRFYGDEQTRRASSSHYRRKAMKSMNQYDVTVGDNDFVVATSVPLVFTAETESPAKNMMPLSKPEQSNDDEEMEQQGETEESSRANGSQYGSPSWYEKMNSKLSTISQEAFTFMQSGLSVISDFQSLRIPTEMRRTNLTKLFSQYRQQSGMVDRQSFSPRDEARQLLEEYIVESDSSMVPPMILLEEQARVGYYRSVFFNSSRIESQGTGKVVLPRTKPYSTWLATGFALHAKSGLTVAQPIRLPTNQGLFVLGNFPEQVQMGEHVCLTYGINNYIGKDLSNVIVRIRASADFDLIEQTKPERVASSNGKDYTVTIPTLKSFAVETRHLVLVPKRSGVVKILIEVECEFGGDHEVLTTYVRESGIERQHVMTRLFDMTNDKKSFGPIVQKLTPSPFLRSVRLWVSGTGLDRLIERYTMGTKSLVGVDRAIIRMWRALGLRGYLNETSQTESPLFAVASHNITTAYQKLQLYSNYDGSYSFVSDEGVEQSSLYLTAMAFGGMMSPLMPVHDNVQINRTLSWILSKQQKDGSFDIEGPCFHYRFCSGEYRREALTALLLYTWTRDNIPAHVPEFIRRQLFNGENSPVALAQRYLESRLEAVKPCVMTTTLVELALIQCQSISEQLKQKIQKNLMSRQLTVVPEDGSKFLKMSNDKMTYDDQILVNSLTVSMYAHFGDMKTTSEIARWIVQQFETMPYYETVLDAVFTTEAWIHSDLLFRRRLGSDKMSVTVDVTADNGQKQQFKIDQTNMDMSQKLMFTLPVNQITYTVSGSGFACVRIQQVYVEKQQQTSEPMPFQITNEMTPMPWFSEIQAKTCLTYTPTTKDQGIKEDFNRTVVLEVQLPSGMRINLRQIGFALSKIENVMHFTFDVRSNKLNFFMNIPSTFYGKPMCLTWIMERLSSVVSWAPIQLRAYDYLRQDRQWATLMPVQFQPNLLGYSFIDAVHKARPTLEQLTTMQKQQSNRN